MKLNPDCVRDLLLAVEAKTDYYTRFEYEASNNAYPSLQEYTHDEIVYHAHQCKLAGLLHECDINLTGAYIMIDDLTPAGHEFLANIRKNQVWEKVKGVASEIGTNSLSSLAEIARLALLEMIKSRFGIS